MPHGLSAKASILAAYTFTWNVLDLPVGAMPITLSREDETHYESAHNDQITEGIKEIMVGASNLPVGIQIVAMPFE